MKKSLEEQLDDYEKVAEKVVYNGEPVWVIVFNKCIGCCIHYDGYFVSIPTIEEEWDSGSFSNVGLKYIFGCGCF